MACLCQASTLTPQPLPSSLICPQEVPQALRSKPHDVFGSRIAALQQLGVDGEALKGVVGRSTVFLTTKGAPQEQLAFLKEDLGFTTEQVCGCWVLLPGQPEHWCGVRWVLIKGLLACPAAEEVCIYGCGMCVPTVVFCLTHGMPLLLSTAMLPSPYHVSCLAQPARHCKSKQVRRQASRQNKQQKQRPLMAVCMHVCLWSLHVAGAPDGGVVSCHPGREAPGAAAQGGFPETGVRSIPATGVIVAALCESCIGGC